ncbi:MAG: hypothetical protein LUF68_09130, partial [Clostridiales bacterium]|nr:hypothetical protein [Clostridiales bacterium]
RSGHVLWLATSGGASAMYYWDGSEGVAAPFGTSALGDGIVTAAKIAAGEVTAEKLNVSELSAITANLGAITAGDITGATITTTGELGYTKLSGGSVTSLGDTFTTAEMIDPDDDNSTVETNGQLYFDMDGGNIDLYAYGTALRTSQLGGLRLAATGIYGYSATLDEDGSNWLKIYNPLKTITIGGTLDVTGETTVNGFRVPEIQRGVVSITPLAANTPTGVMITFDQEFSGTPRCVACPATTVPGTVVTGVSVASVSTTGMTVYLTRTTVVATNIHWIAIY